MLRTRIISGVVLGALLISFLLWLPPWWSVALFALAIVCGAWEWSAFMRISAVGPRILYVVIIAALLVAGWHFSADPAVLRGVLASAALWWLLALAWVAFAPRRITTIGAAAAGVLTLVPAWIALARMRIDWDQGAEWTLFLLVLVAGADTGAYFAGRLFGRRKLAPLVSPGKTWEGAAGGLVFTALLAVAAAWWFAVPAAPLIGVCVVVAVFSIVGDLSESMLKRHAGLKDSGTIIPGHGGVLDRIDSITAAGPLLVLMLPLVLAGVGG